MKRILALILCAIMFLSVSAIAAEGEVSVVVNGNAVAFDVKPQIINDRTMVPLRAIFEALGATVEWDDATKTVSAYNEEVLVTATIGVNEITVNGKVLTTDVAPCIVESRTLVPARFVAEAFGCDVNWDANTRTVHITKPEVPYYEGTIIPDYGKLYDIDLMRVDTRKETGDLIYNYLINKANKTEEYKTFLENHGWTYLRDENNYVGTIKVYNNPKSNHYVKVFCLETGTASDHVTIYVSNKPQYTFYENTSIPDYEACSGITTEGEPVEGFDNYTVYRFDGTDLAAYDNYSQVLAELGFTKVKEVEETEYYGYCYEKGSERVDIYFYIYNRIAATYVVTSNID